MGNNTSKPSRKPQRRQHGRKAQSVQISGPSGGLQMIPTPQRDGSGRPLVHGSFEMNRDQLLIAFQYMAEYLHRQGVNLCIYVAGGAVNTIYLRSRHTTGDVDFFGANDKSRHLRDASKYAQQRSTCQLGANWFNNSMSLFLTRTIEQDLIAAARRQNAVLFSKPGLAVYAVPWEYALCGKTDRLTKSDRRPYDTSDAVAYLSQCIKGNRGRAIQAQQVEAWARKYNKAVSRSVLIEIDAAYKRSHGEHGIMF
ncbi:uncharacterized protein N7446_013857 [Penicillium canescens]|uniref:DUF7582 domain-containing protein n=1 Tax=Penicillium canescens TaxID=5083 RepID=A0AAD6HZR4_PENCN|nr:uncharacterized protein N7446_013857 [Penicillium canescens]KAJ6023494.1 hypothetical protein N7460_013889 [Penicillium canescens]KAJ6025233.1 hypothetical protein N7444_012912 [Penicillium canescens]KAJ6042791.1 hypothetical protein N7446_013857 [Penicillium canescens]